MSELIINPGKSSDEPRLDGDFTFELHPGSVAVDTFDTVDTAEVHAEIVEEMHAVAPEVSEKKLSQKSFGSSKIAGKKSSGKRKSSFSLGKKKSKEEELVINTYKYTGVDAAGKKASGTVKAATYGEAQYGLLGQGLTELTIKVYQPWYNLEFGKTVPLDELLQMTRQLSSFSQAGITAARGLSILSKTTEHKKMRQVLTELVLDIEGGATLSESVSRHPHVFPSYYSTILGAAERSGDLVDALETLNNYLERDLRSRRAVRSAMIYPIVLISLTVVAVTVLSVVVLPRFQVFFHSLDVKLPATTALLLSTTHFVATWWWGIGAGMLTFIVTIGYLAKNPKTRIYIDRLIITLPIVGGLARLVSLERFCRVLSTLVKTQVPLPDALELAGNASGNMVFKNAILDARLRVLNGEGLAEPLSEYKIFPIAAIQILRIGEESGQLQSQLHQAAAFYSDELDHRMKNFTALLEPATLLFIGGGVGFVAVALVSAMYGIYSGVKQ